jgi:hypothetical protein
MQYYEFGHFDSNRESLTLLGDQGMWEKLTDILYAVPRNILDDVLRNCVFLMLNEKEFPGAFIHKKLIEGKSGIAFCNLDSQDRDKQGRIILHEIAHYVLGHINERLSDEEYHKINEEAESLRVKWESDWEKHLKGPGP